MITGIYRHYLRDYHRNDKGFLNSTDRSHNVTEAWLAFGFLTFCFAVILPDLFFLRLSPMGGYPSAIKDPTVSWAAFMPAFREFRYELFENGNILWSNLRSLGLPLLGNGIQGAPLFPLNLSLIWLPDSLYWSVMPILRVILIGLGAYLLSRRVLGLSLAASLCFALLAGFNVNVMRWINHPWQNGLLAGIWYTYFCCTLFIHNKQKRTILFWHWLGLVVAVFGMITNGFPEASALAALLALFLFIAFMVTHWSDYRSSLFRPFVLIVLAHIVGLSLSAIQIFALLEFIDVGAAMELREGFIGGTFKAQETVPFILSQFSHFWVTPELLKYLNFSIGLFGTFFLVRGLCLWLKISQRPWIGVACLLMMALYIVKSFGLLSVVESAFANIPVLAQSHFPLYFSPLFYFGAAYFVALGVESYIKTFDDTMTQRLIDVCVSSLAILVVLALCVWNIAYFVDLPWFGLIEFIFTEQLQHFLVFIIGITFLVGYQFLNLFDRFSIWKLTKRLTSSLILGTLLVSCFIAEMSISHFDRHARIDNRSLGLNKDLNSTFDEAVENTPYPRHELRSNDRNGDFVGYGIATIDNGVSAILPPDQRRIRINLFQTPFGGYFPVDASRRDWSWEMLSANIVLVSTTPRVSRDWAQYQAHPGIRPKVLDWQQSMTRPRKEPFYLEGSVQGFFAANEAPLPWIHFAGKHHDFWLEGNIAGNELFPMHNERQRIVTKWRIRIPNSWLEEDQYEITVRLSEKNSGGYADTPATTLNLTPLKPNPEKYKKYPNLVNAPLIAASPDEDLHIFYNPNALPRAYVASRCSANISEQQNVDFLRASNNVLNGHITLGALSEKTALSDTLDCSRYSADFRRVAIETDSGSHLQLETVSGPAIVTVNNYYYPGWTATDTISGEELPIHRANSIFRAVHLPENREYQLTMDYQPWWLTFVYLLLALGLSIIVIVFWWLGKARKPRV